MTSALCPGKIKPMGKIRTRREGAEKQAMWDSGFVKVLLAAGDSCLFDSCICFETARKKGFADEVRCSTESQAAANAIFCQIF